MRVEAVDEMSERRPGGWCAGVCVGGRQSMRWTTGGQSDAAEAQMRCDGRWELRGLEAVLDSVKATATAESLEAWQRGEARRIKEGERGRNADGCEVK